MRHRLFKFLVPLLSIIASFLVLEISLRVYDGEYEFRSFLGEIRTLLNAGKAVTYDPELGWTPTVGYSSDNNFFGTQITILRDGTRSNGRPIGNPPASAEIILAIGDSMTFGEEVADGETWPAHLERLSERTVLNAGVPGYGVDQSYLRTRQLVEKYDPDILIFSFIADDIGRAEAWLRFGAPKPYFELIENQLVLRNTPVPLREETVSGFEKLKSVFGYSYAIHKLMMMNRYKAAWIARTGLYRKAHDYGADVACVLLKNLEGMAARRRIKLYVLAQYMRSNGDPEYAKKLELVDGLLSCIGDPSTTVVDLRYILEATWRLDKDSYRRLFKRVHMTSEGNRLVAERLFEVMRKNHDL